MSSYLESYCNTTTDLAMEEPLIDSFDRKRRVETFQAVSGITYAAYDVGYVGKLFRAGVDLGAAQSTLGAVDTDGEWFYDPATDCLTLASTQNPNTYYRVEAGRLWTDVKTEAVGRASDFVRSYINKPIIRRQGVGVQSETLRPYDDVIIRATAMIACALLIRPYDRDRADYLEGKCWGGETPGLLDKIKSGDIALSEDITRRQQEGIVKVVSQNASSTGDIIGTAGTANCFRDWIKVAIAAGGTLTAGSASAVTYSVWIGDSTGIKTTKVIDGAIITGGLQTAAHGLYIRFSAGVYTTGDEWEIEAAGEPEEAGTSGARTITLTRI